MDESSPEMADLALKIKRLVEERGWNQEDFARSTRLNRHTARQILLPGGSRRLRNATISACAKALGLTVNELRTHSLERLLPRMAEGGTGGPTERWKRPAGPGRKLEGRFEVGAQRLADGRPHGGFVVAEKCVKHQSDDTRRGVKAGGRTSGAVVADLRRQLFDRLPDQVGQEVRSGAAGGDKAVAAASGRDPGRQLGLHWSRQRSDRHGLIVRTIERKRFTAPEPLYLLDALV